MALTEGTNCGFVTSAPSADPVESNAIVDGTSVSGKFTAPADGTITEIGWWCDTASEECNFEVGLYSHDSGDDSPDARLQVDATNAKGTGAGWKVCSGLSWAITNATIYWLAVQVDAVATATNINYAVATGRRANRASQTALTDPFPADATLTDSRLVGIYALYTTAGGTGMQINIGDAWKTVDAMQINIGDAWKSVDGVQINVGDAWKAVF